MDNLDFNAFLQEFFNQENSNGATPQMPNTPRQESFQNQTVVPISVPMPEEAIDIRITPANADTYTATSVNTASPEPPASIAAPESSQRPAFVESDAQYSRFSGAPWFRIIRDSRVSVLGCGGIGRF